MVEIFDILLILGLGLVKIFAKNILSSSIRHLGIAAR